ncbi:MAG: glycosyltransferase family 39 protein [Bacteroidia bacterium]|nr:glycosyltransferase family 39 protein [Bacteroidia bacterium]
MKTIIKGFNLFGYSGHVQFIIGLIFILTLSYFTIFFHLDRLTLRVWDESTYLYNAENMVKHPDLFMVYDFKGNPECFSPKPPFYTWVAAISLLIIPHNPELAIRMPAALFTLFTVLLLYGFCYYYLKNYAAGILSATVLLSSVGFFQWHIVRTGDTDSTYVFWCLLCLLSFFVYTVEEGKKRTIALVLAGLGMLFAALTKGPGILILFPPFFIWLFVSKNFMNTVKSFSFWVVLGLVIVFIFGWYYCRESLNPGFLQAVWKQEIMGRIQLVEPQTHQENHALFFLYRLFDKQFFMPWILFLISAFFMSFGKEKTAGHEFLKFVFLVWICCILSIARTVSVKDWYDAIWYPLMSLLTGVGISLLIKNWEITASRSVFFGLLLLSSWPLSIIIKKNIFEAETQHLKPFLNLLRQGEYKFRKIFIYEREFNPAVFYYIKQDQQNGFDSELWKYEVNNLPEGTDVLTMNQNQEEELARNFKIRKLEELNECKLFYLELKKKPSIP